MGLCGKLGLVIFAVAAVYVGLQINSLLEVPPVPKLEEVWWGPGGRPAEEDTAIKPFKINVPNEVSEKLIWPWPWL